MNSPRITFLVPNVGSPIIGVAARFASCLRDRYAVEIVGPDFGGGVCSMYCGSFDYTVVPAGRLYRLPDFCWESRRLGRAVTGDVIVAMKAFADTIPVALREKKRRGAKVIVYLDEWDGALYYQLDCLGRLRSLLTELHHPMETMYHPVVERLIPKADEVISSSSFLQGKFGGRILHLGVDCDFFKPQPPEKTAQLRGELDLKDDKVVLFGGVVRPHKGVETVLDALVALAPAVPGLRFVVVGPKTDCLAALMQHPRYASLIRCIGAPPEDPEGFNWSVHERMPAYLDLADVIAVPLGDNLLARSQVPCKVFEAMAMAKPVVASAVSDLPQVLDGCGWTVPPGDVQGLAQRIQYVFDHPDEAREKGETARKKCVAEYSREQTGKQLADVIEEVWTR